MLTIHRLTKRLCRDQPDGRLRLFLVIITSTILSILLLTNYHTWGDDWAGYVGQARSIASGTHAQYEAYNSFTATESDQPLGPINYPWGLPLLLSIPYSLFGESLIGLKLVNIICLFLLYLVIWNGLSQTHTVFSRLVIVSLFAISPVFISEASNEILSDIPFLLISTFLIFKIKRVILLNEFQVNLLFDGLLIGILIGASQSIRPNGVLLLITLIFSQMIVIHRSKTLNRNFRENNLLHIFFLPIIGFMIFQVTWRSVFPDSIHQIHINEINNITTGSILRNLQYYAFLIQDYFSIFQKYNLVGFIFYPISVYYFFLGLRNSDNNKIEIFYILITLGLYILWPGTQGLRFLFPLLPFYFSFMLTGIEHAIAEKHSFSIFNIKLYKLFLTTLLIWNSLLSIALIHFKQVRSFRLGPYSPSTKEMVSFLKERTESNATVLFFKPRFLQLVSDRKSFKSSNIQKGLQSNYIAISLSVGSSDQPDFGEITDYQNNGMLELLYTNRNYHVYKVVK